MDFGSVEVIEDTRDAGARGSKIVASAAGSFEWGEFSRRRITWFYWLVNRYRVVFIRMTLPSIRIHFFVRSNTFPGRSNVLWRTSSSVWRAHRGVPVPRRIETQRSCQARPCKISDFGGRYC